MDNSLILEFSTREEAMDALTVINAMAAAWWAGQGYTVQDGQLVGKNAATGQDEPDAQKTTKWADIQESQDGTFYFPSLSNDARFQDWRDYLPEGVSLPEDKVFPPEWAPAAEE